MKQMDIDTFRPRLKVLNRDQVRAIHKAALEILEKTGFKTDHPRVLEMLDGAGCSVSKDNWVKLPSYLVEEALRTVPRQFTLYDQEGNRAMRLVDVNSFFGTGSDTTFTIDLTSFQSKKIYQA